MDIHDWHCYINISEVTTFIVSLESIEKSIKYIAIDSSPSPDGVLLRTIRQDDAVKVKFEQMMIRIQITVYVGLDVLFDYTLSINRTKSCFAAIQ